MRVARGRGHDAIGFVAASNVVMVEWLAAAQLSVTDDGSNAPLCTPGREHPNCSAAAPHLGDAEAPPCAHSDVDTGCTSATGGAGAGGGEAAETVAVWVGVKGGASTPFTLPWGAWLCATLLWLHALLGLGTLAGMATFGTLLRAHTTFHVPTALGTASAQPPTRIVFSVTTRPGTEDVLADTLESLATQTRPFDHGYVVLPGDQSRPAPPIPRSLAGRVTVLRPRVDVGPLAKLLHAVEAESDPSAVVVTVDDDKVYSHNLVRELLVHVEASPGAAVSVCGWSMLTVPAPSGGAVWLQSIGAPFVARGRHGLEVDVLQGFCGAAYRARSFDVRGLRDVLPACRTVDDMWVSHHLARRAVTRVLLPPGTGQHFLDEPDSAAWTQSPLRKRKRLSAYNSREGVHLACLQALERAYGPWPRAA